MSVQTSEQLLHDRVNLARLVRQLEKSVASEQWATSTGNGNERAWVKAQGTVQVGCSLSNTSNAYNTYRKSSLLGNF